MIKKKLAYSNNRNSNFVNKAKNYSMKYIQKYIKGNKIITLVQKMTKTVNYS